MRKTTFYVAKVILMGRRHPFKQKDNNRPCLNYGTLWNLGSNSSFIFKIRSGSTLKILTSFDIESDSNYLTTVSFANLTLIQIDK